MHGTACEGVCAFSLWFFWGIFLLFFVTSSLQWVCAHKNTKRDQKKHKSNIKWMGIVHVSVSGCEPNQYVSSWSVCESVSMCAGHIACEGVCAFSLWFFFFVFFFFVFFFFYFFVTVGTCTQKHKKGPKKHKSNIKWMGIVHVSVSGCGPNHYVSSWLVGWLVGQSVGRSVSWSSIFKLVGWSVIKSVGWSVGRSVSWSSIIKLVGWLVGQSSSQLVGWSVGQSVGRQSSSRSVGRLFGSVGWSYV